MTAIEGFPGRLSGVDTVLSGGFIFFSYFFLSCPFQTFHKHLELFLDISRL